MTATTATNEQIAAAIVDRAIRTLEPPQVLETGTLVLLRMAAHSRSPNQQEYFAPAVVLAQYEPNGEIDALVWDASAGNAFVHGYAIRDLGTRDTWLWTGRQLVGPQAVRDPEQHRTGAVFAAAVRAGCEQELEILICRIASEAAGRRCVI